MFQQWAREIVNTFPGENVSTYYVPYAKDATNNGINAHGKLLFHYEYLKNVLKKNKVLKQSETINISESVREKLANLRSQVSPWNEIQKLWQETCEARQTLLKTKNTSVAAYFHDYPCLRVQRGLELVNIMHI